ncbi:MAG: TIR domain-containing protein [Anaerolineales bacterium]|nr:TIR domain-containing protein [Anaerolineales bacterium]
MANKPRTYISFDFDNDQWARDLFVSQAKNPDTPFFITDYSQKYEFTEKWKTQCRERIKQTSLVIQLVGANTWKAAGADWEVKAAKEEKIPVFGVYIDKNNHGKIPSNLQGSPVIDWTWDGIAAMIKKLTS